MFNMSLKVILIMTAVTASIMIGLTGAVGIYTLNSVEKNYEHIEKVNVRNAEIIASLSDEVHKANEAVYSFAVKSTEDGNAQTELNNELTGVQRKINDLIEEKKQIETTDEQKQLFNSLIETYRKYYADLESYKSLASSSSTTKDKTALLQFLNGEFKSVDNEILKQLDTLKTNEHAEEEKWEALAESTSEKAHTWLPIMIGIFCLLMLSIAVGIGLILDRKIKSVTSKLLSQADDLNTAAIRVAEASTELSSGVTEQAAAIQETAASMDEINAMIAKNAESSKKSETLAMTSFHNAEKGQQAVNSMISSINSINEGTNDIFEEVTRSNKKITEIVEVINEIGNKTKVINDIVFQTKLLSFNASVEAARAGEYGKGFTVVAKEVGDLAQMSGAASEEISGLLDKSIQKVQNIVDETKSNIESLVKKSRAKVDAGLEVAQDGAEVLNEIVENISTVRTMVSEIATASHEQAHGVAEVHKALGQLDQATQQNSQATYQNSAASEQLKTQSGSLKDLVADMIAIIDGKSKQAKSSATAAPSKPVIAPIKKPVKTEAKLAELKKISMAKEAEAKKSKPELKIVVENPTKSKIPSDVPRGDSPGFTE